MIARVVMKHLHQIVIDDICRLDGVIGLVGFMIYNFRSCLSHSPSSGGFLFSKPLLAPDVFHLLGEFSLVSCILGIGCFRLFGQSCGVHGQLGCIPVQALKVAAKLLILLQGLLVGNAFLSFWRIIGSH